MIPNTKFDLKKSYTVQIKATDDIGEYDIKPFEIPTEDVALHLGKGGKNVSVGSYCDYSKEHTFHSEWDAHFDKDVYIDGKKLDYIVEQGTKDSWTYRKWASGIAECWGVYWSTAKPEWDNMSVVCNENLPFEFIANPIVTCSGGQYATHSSYVMLTVGTPTYVSAYMRCGNEPVGEYVCWFHFDVKGRWK